jgi:arginase family enzyme
MTPPVPIGPTGDAAGNTAAGYGFGGAPVVELDRLPGASRPGDVVFFGVDTELGRRFGQGNPGAASFVRERTAGMMPWTRVAAPDCHDIGIVTATDPGVAMRETTAIATYLSRIGRRPALIGCDHTASLAAVLGTAAGGGTIPTYLYFDAHLDLGLHDPTPGAGPALHNGNFVELLRQTGQVGRVVNVGGRCWSRFAPVYDTLPDFTCIPGGAPQPSAAALIERLSWLAGSRLYVSIDADVLDPSAAPNVCCPEPFGLSTAELFSVCAWLGESCTVIGGDLCEVVPSTPGLCSEQALVRCLHALYRPQP